MNPMDQLFLWQISCRKGQNHFWHENCLKIHITDIFKLAMWFLSFHPCRIMEAYSIVCVCHKKAGPLDTFLKKFNKYLYWVIVKIWDDDMFLRVNGDKMGPSKFSRIGSSGTKFLYQFSVRLKDQNTGGTIIYHHQMAGTVYCNAFGAWKSKKRGL